jgi:hypothetical protein
MIYYSEYDLVFITILKNGTNAFAKLFTYVMGKEPEPLFFTRQPTIHMTVVRNPYERLLTQFYHANRRQLWKEFKYTVHHPFFRKWVKETYSNGYDGEDGHLYTQTQFLQFVECQMEYKVFKAEEFSAHELFFFLNLTEERKAEIDKEYSKIIIELETSAHHATNSIKQGVWQSFYDAETIKICNNHYADDFKAFNYEIIKPEEFKPIYFEYKTTLI